LSPRMLTILKSYISRHAAEHARQVARYFALIAALFALSGDAESQSQEGFPSVVRCNAMVTDAAAVPATLASDRQRIYFGTSNGIMAALDKLSLERVWRTELGGEFVSNVLTVEGGHVAVTNPTGNSGPGGDVSRIHSLSSSSGVPVWTAKLPQSERYFLGRINGSVAAVAQNGAIYLFDALTGALQRQFAERGRVSARPYFYPTGVVFGTVEKRVISLSSQDAEFSAKQLSEYVPTAVISLKDGNLAVGDERGTLSIIDRQDARPIWKFKSGGAISSITETDEGLLLTSLDNFVYLVSDYNGDVIWKRRLTGRIVDGGLLMNGLFVAVIYGENSVFLIDRRKGKVAGVVLLAEKELTSRAPALTGEHTFALTSAESIETYSIGPCPVK